MANDPGPNEVGAWLVSPLTSGEARIFVAVSEGTALTPEVRQALDALAMALQQAGEDVQGMGSGCVCKFKKCDLLVSGCNPFTLRQTEPGVPGLQLGIPPLPGR